MSRWFRHYAGMMRDEKLVRVAVRSKQPVHLVVWVWGAILESAAEINDGGRYDFDTGEAAYFLRCGEDELLAVVAALGDMGHVLEGAVVKWSDRQYDSDQSRERQKRYRDRHKAQRNSESDVTPPSRDAAVTPQETDTDTEKKVAPKGALAISDFDRFWAVYPEKVGKGAARKAFAKAIAKAPLAVLVDGVTRYIETKPSDRNYCHPATWLNEERWDDQPAAPPMGIARASPVKTNPARDVIATLRERMTHAVPDEETGSDRPPPLQLSYGR